MIIQRLDLIAYGRFTDTLIDLSAGPRRFHIIYGPNESGKSTSLRAITSLLYGMTTRAEDNYLHANAKIRVGGVLVGPAGESLTCVRRRGKKGTLRESDDSTVIPDAKLEAMLGGVDREAFEHRFGLSHEELVQGGKAILEGEGDLGEILFAAGAGVSQLKAVQSKLDENVTQLFVAGGSKGAINILSREIAEKKRQLEAAKILPREWEGLQNELTQQQQRVKQWETTQRDAAVRMSQLRAYLTALPLVPQWRSCCESLVSLADVPLLDSAFSERRRTLETSREIALRQTNSHTTRITELQQELDLLSDDAEIMIHEAEISSLFQRLGAREEARTQRTGLQRTKRNLDRRMTETLGELSIEIHAADGDAVTDEIDESLKQLRVVDSVRTHVNELAQQYALLVRQRDDADEELRSLKRKLAALDQRDVAERVPDDPFAIGQVIESVGSPDSVLANLTQQKSDAKQSQLRCEQLARKLDSICPKMSGSFVDSVHDLVNVPLPSESAIAKAVQTIERREQAVATATQQWSQLDARQRSQQEKLEAASSLTELPNMEQLAAARDRRDDAFCSMIADHSAARLSMEDFTRLQSLIRKADELVDQMRQHHEQIHLQATLQSDLDEVIKHKADCQAQGESAKAELDQANSDWQSLWRPLGIAAASPRAMQTWVATHAQLVDSISNDLEERERLEQIQRRIAAACERLRHAIAAASVGSSTAQTATSGSGAPTSIDSDDETIVTEEFPRLHDEAIRLRANLQHARKRYEEQLKQIDTLQDELPKAEARLESRQQQLDRWDSDWATATSALAASVDRTPAVILEKIKQIDDLNAQKRERDILLHRINAMFADDQTYRGDVARLALSLGNEFNENDGEISDAFTLVKSFFERLQNARSDSKQRAALTQQVAATQKKLAAAQQQVNDADIALGLLCEEAACDSPDQLLDVERRSNQRQQFEQSKQSVEQQLRMLAGSVLLEAFVEEVSQQQAELLSIEIEQVEGKLTDAQAQLSLAQQALGELRGRIAKVDGSGQAAALSQELHFLTGKLENELEEYSRVKIAAMILRQAIEDYRQENQGPVLQLASGIFSQLTRNEYASLKVDFDNKGKATLFGVRPAGQDTDVPANAMSTGTADTLYLSLRLASIDHQLSRSTPLPLVVDDCLVQLDDGRSAAAMRAFSDLSQRTQVILFTHHEHLIELAEQTLAPDEFHVHRLGS